MNKLSVFFLILYLLLFAAAAPRLAASSTSSASLSHNSTSTSTSTSSSNTPFKHPISSRPLHRPEPEPTQRSSPFIPHPGFTSPTRSVSHDRPFSTGGPFPGSRNHSQSGQKPISIVFEVLGGLFASALLLGFIRCFYNYRKTPGRDRIAEILQRHQLQRELEELERNPGLLRRYPSLREPAPPYFPRPPSYEQGSPAPPNPAAPRERPPGPDNRAQYSPIATSSPPSTPPMAEHILLPTPAATLQTHSELPT